ncbi:hypothetical protein PLEOSDRAFT_1075683 [Pleurotus ostreatus PC15]|uniref:Fido domain-containing protein n=1 Tax=Pleurotus ostreatus (strain PC15) TaxID=1137138 RepID=A0A067NKZ7_PLEO1|nr:hypothetical protein PLEOSDRAFT_1075683 [Pleurotus ostreatus PC15]
MAAHAPRLARLFTPMFARTINAQLVHPAAPLQRAYYRPEASQAELAASLSYGIIKGHPFLDGNKITAFFLANEYIRAQGHPGLADGVQVGEVYKGLQAVVDQYVGVASGRLEEDALALANGGAKSKDS